MLRTVGAFIALLTGPCALVETAAVQPDPPVYCAAIGCSSPAGDACEAQPAAQAIRADGYGVDCSPPFASLSPTVQGMTDHQARVVYIWPPSNSAATIAVLWHEHGHVLAELRGWSFPTQAAEETWAWGYSFCRDPQPGVGYPIRPTDCTGYR